MVDNSIFADPLVIIADPLAFKHVIEGKLLLGNNLDEVVNAMSGGMCDEPTPRFCQQTRRHVTLLLHYIFRCYGMQKRAPRVLVLMQHQF